MNLKAHYDQLYKNAKQRIVEDTYTLDPLVEVTDDGRLGITLLFRPSEAIKEAIQNFLDVLKTVDSNQYYYPSSDIHITVMSIISCYNGFDINQINVSDYIAVIEKSLSKLNPFHIEFKGVTASPSCVMIQGFLDSDVLNTFRDSLRSEFKNSKLQQSLDARYAIQTAHATVVRFKNELQSKSEFIQTLEDFRTYNFGRCKVENLELVYNDWYQRKAKVCLLHDFKIV